MFLVANKSMYYENLLIIIRFIIYFEEYTILSLSFDKPLAKHILLFCIGW